MSGAMAFVNVFGLPDWDPGRTFVGVTFPRISGRGELEFSGWN